MREITLEAGTTVNIGGVPCRLKDAVAVETATDLGEARDGASPPSDDATAR